MPGLFCDAYRDVRLGRIDDSCRVVLVDYLLLWGRHSLSRHLFHNVRSQVFMTGLHSMALQCTVDFCCDSCVIYVNIGVGWWYRWIWWWSLYVFNQPLQILSRDASFDCHTM